MKTIIDARYIDMTGIGLYVKTYINRAIKYAYQNEIAFLFSYANLAKKYIQDLEENGYKTIFIKSLPFQLREHWELWNIIYRYKPTNIHIPHFNVPIVCPKGVSRTVTIHDLALDLFPEGIKSWKHKLYYKIIIKKALNSKNIIAISNHTQKNIKQLYHKTNVTVIHNGYIRDTNSVVNNSRLKSTFLYIGINTPRKNLKFLIDVFDNLPSDYNLILAGNMQSNSFDIQKYIAEKNLSPKIRLLGYISDQKRRELYQTCTALIFPSLLEGFGFPLLEAADNGLPVICSNSSVLPEIGGDACLYFDPKNNDDCRQKIEELINNKVLREELVKKGYELLNQYDADLFFKKTVAEYGDSA